jgi:excisionase family DNA binding protein
MHRLISNTEAAARMGVYPRTNRHWVAAYLVPSYRVGPRLIRIDAEALRLQARAVKTGRVTVDKLGGGTHRGDRAQ